MDDNRNSYEMGECYGKLSIGVGKFYNVGMIHAVMSAYFVY